VIEDLGLVVSSSGCPLLIREAQLEGKARSTAPVLLQQLKPTPGDRFGDGLFRIPCTTNALEPRPDQDPARRVV